MSFKDKYFNKNLGNYPDQFQIGEWVYEKSEDLRYGTNPHQPAAFYRIKGNVKQPFGSYQILKEGKNGLSQTNLEDANQAVRILKYFKKPAAAVMKHLNPSGVAVQWENESLSSVYQKARDVDAQAAFGSSVVFNVKVDQETAEAIMSSIVENVYAPDFSEEALEVFKNFDKYKKNKEIRIVKLPDMTSLPKYIGNEAIPEIKVLQDGSLILALPYLTRIQDKNDLLTPSAVNKEQKKIECIRKPTEKEYDDLLFSWYVNIGVRSNGIVIAKNGVTLAVGTGEQDRVGALEQAIIKAKKKSKIGVSLEGASISSDGFFPFRDSIDLCACEGITAIIQPGGSVRDFEVIEACNEKKIAMVFTDERCFSHH
ncbi:MAG TPA: IMP cyclohydrolase [Spirochaetia bacterium]|nr:IMP cyclohydrolase [Spirochaetia bacterium]